MFFILLECFKRSRKGGGRGVGDREGGTKKGEGEKEEDILCGPQSLKYLLSSLLGKVCVPIPALYHSKEVLALQLHD